MSLKLFPCLLVLAYSTRLALCKFPSPDSASYDNVQTPLPEVEQPSDSLPTLNGPYVSQYEHAPSAAPYLAVQALQVMQDAYYETWLGTWPSSIDWTGAVINTYISAMLESLDRHSHEVSPTKPFELIDRYFSHTIAYYFGEEAFSIRNEAYDDMLWVVLGWLESVKFIKQHHETDATWHGTDFAPGFVHRARVFWDLAARGWDTDICGGGMIWNPRLTPYKNAITNQLFISASVSMYLYSPGDNNSFPYFVTTGAFPSNSTPGREHDTKYLRAAIKGYNWLKNSNMTNKNGLFIDGFHVTGWGLNGTVGTGKCDERNEMVFTYNQGVILSGLRGLWEATGDQDYLEDGYSLIRNVMKATGWSRQISEMSHKWAGLGQSGILEETCDRTGRCSQDAQTFKGIFFQHLTQFCEPLPLQAAAPGKTHSASKALAALHQSNCLVIGDWVMHNAKAALKTRNSEGKFGMWWGSQSTDSMDEVPLPRGAKDYRNNPELLSTSPWAIAALERPKGSLTLTVPIPDMRRRFRPKCGNTQPWNSENYISSDGTDPNDRGRGRTVETQGGGLSVLRAAWELTRRTRAVD